LLPTGTSSSQRPGPLHDSQPAPAADAREEEACTWLVYSI
jgi:hypothetical protein